LKRTKSSLTAALAIALFLTALFFSPPGVQAARLSVDNFSRLDSAEGFKYLDNYGMSGENNKTANLSKYIDGISNDGAYVYGISFGGGYNNIKNNYTAWGYKIGAKDWIMFKKSEAFLANPTMSHANTFMAYQEINTDKDGMATSSSVYVQELAKPNGNSAPLSVKSNGHPMAFSPDEANLAYVNKDHQLTIYNLKTKKFTTLENKDFMQFDSRPAWSPDSKEAYFLGTTLDTTRLYSYNLETQQLTTLFHWGLPTMVNVTIVGVSDSGKVAIGLSQAYTAKFGSNLLSVDPVTKEAKPIGANVIAIDHFLTATLSKDFAKISSNDKIFDVKTGNSVLAAGKMSPDGRRFISAYVVDYTKYGFEQYDISGLFKGASSTGKDLKYAKAYAKFGSPEGITIAWEVNAYHAGYSIKKDGNTIVDYQDAAELIRTTSDAADFRIPSDGVKTIRFFDQAGDIRKDATYEITAYDNVKNSVGSTTIRYSANKKAKLGNKQAALGSKVKLGGVTWSLIGDNYLLADKSIGQSYFRLPATAAPKFDESAVSAFIQKWMSKNLSAADKSSLASRKWQITDIETNKVQYTYTGNYGLPSTKDFSDLPFDIRVKSEMFFLRELPSPYKKNVKPQILTTFFLDDYTFGAINRMDINVNLSIRPVVYLKETTKLTGSGTPSDPYKVSSAK